MTPQPRILFVCRGNICRSPLAEAAFRAAAAEAGLDAAADSAGTSPSHVGEAPDARAQAVARRHGLDISELRGRQVEPDDFRRFTHIVALDASNLAKLRALTPPDATATLTLLLDCVQDRRGEGVPDPYDGTYADFQATWRDVDTAAHALARQLAGDAGSPMVG